MTFNGITILGLGPGDPQLITRQAWEILKNCKEVYLKTRQHPAIAELPEGIIVHSFEDLSIEDTQTEDISERLISTILGFRKTQWRELYMQFQVTQSSMIR